MDKQTKVLTGRDSSHLVDYNGFKLLEGTLDSFLKLKKTLSPSIELSIVSAFRSYERQLHIWNEKAEGKRKLYNRAGKLIDYKTLSNREKLEAIMIWSAIPGASRHHWGSDLDVFDKKVKDKSQVDLNHEEYLGDFAHLTNTLTNLIESSSSCGFFRPYDKDRGAISVELWHISDENLSKDLLSNYTLEVFEENLIDSEIIFKDEILKKREEIFGRYIVL